jgi:hypothetical protein
MAAVLLQDLPADDPNARLLRVAVLRRDEVLIDGVLGVLHARALSRG